MGFFGKKDTEMVVAGSNAVAKRPITDPLVDKETIQKYMKATGLTSELYPAEAEMFIDMAVMHQLNPFKREVHCVAYGSGDYRTLSIVTGYEVYIAKAEKSGKLEYWDMDECSPDTPVSDYWCTLTVKRRDRRKEQKWTTHYEEVVQFKGQSTTPNKFWAKQPRFMTRKVCMGQGFRLFFEDILHGVPYIEGEVADYSDEPLPSEPKPIQRAEPVHEPSFEVVEEAGTAHDAAHPKKAEPVAKVAEPAPSRESTFSQIMKIINSGQVPNDKKVRIMIQAREFKNADNEEGLKTILKNMKEDFNL